MNRKPTILRHWLATLLAAVCIPLGTQTAWADDDPFYAARTARTNNTFTFSQPAYNVETTVEYVDAGASIRPTGNTDATNDLYYLTLADALADAADGDVIKLLADETITTGLTIYNSITLDLNGHTLTCTGTNKVALTVSSGNTVTIQDGGTGGGITGTLAGIENNGTLTVTGGTITGTGDNGSGIYNSDNATLTVTGGTITCSGNYGKGIGNGSAATLTVSGGTITCSGTYGCGISNDATLTISGTPTISATSTSGKGILHDGTAFNLSGSPTISGTYADIYLNTDKIITINAALTAPTTGETPVADPWTVESDNIEGAPATPYIFTTGFSTYCKVGEDVADPAAYFDCITANITTRLASNEAQFVQYIPLDADVAATVPVIINNGQTDDGTRAASLDEGNVWVGDQLSVSTTATPGITWQWYRVSGTTETAISEATASTYTLTAEDVGKTIIAKATQPANIAGTGYPAADVTVASVATVAVVKKDNFGELTAATIPVEDGKVDYVSVTITNASTGVQYMVVADGVTPTEAHWALATTPTANGNLTLNQFVKIDNEVAVLSNMLPTTSYDLYYCLVETATTKHGTTATTNGKPVNELKADITTKTFDYKVTTQGVTYKISEDPAATVTAAVTAIPTAGDGDHKTATILSSIPKNNAELTARIDVWEALGYDVTGTAFTNDIAVSLTGFDTDIDLSAIGNSAANYGYIQAMDDNMYDFLKGGTTQNTCTEEGYVIYLMNGGYYALSNADGEYMMANKGKAVIESGMTEKLTIAELAAADQGSVVFKDKAGVVLPIGTGLNAGKSMAASGQKIVVEVKLPLSFEFKSDAAKVLNVTHGTTTNEITLADPGNTGTWTAEFTMPTQNATVSFKETDVIQGREIGTYTYTAPAAGATVTLVAGSLAAVHVNEPLVYTIEPLHTGVNYYALTGLGLTEGVTATIVDAADETQTVTLPTEKTVKVTLTVPATFVGDAVTFAPEMTICAEDITFVAGNMTYFDSKGIALLTDNENLKIYTVSAVSGTGVTLSEITSKQIPENTPVIVKNTSDAPIVARMDLGTYDAVTFASQFKGTAEAKTTANTDSNGPWNMAVNTKYYGFNGADFVWINGAGDVAAHRCWLELSATTSAPALTIQWPDGETTSIDVRSKREDVRNETFYDLSGRKLQGKPQRKGVYILNGQKKVVK